MTEKVKLDDIVSLCKRRGFIYQGSEIYGGLAGTWDYGPLGVTLKKNIMDLWWNMFVENRDDMYGVDAAILMNQKVWQASGHTNTFTDPLVECSNCKGRFRADHLEGDKCLSCGKTGTLSEPRQFNMMFKTFVGPTTQYHQTKNIEDVGLKNVKGVDDFLGPKHRIEYNDDNLTYLRPETAQGIFTNYKNVVDSFSPDMPFGIAQQGKAFRNEISPRDFVFRSREFEQMEIEYFVDPKTWEEQFENWRKNVWEFLDQLGLPKTSVHELDVPKDELAHYSKRTIDFEFDYLHKRDELLGLAYRTDHDLASHQDKSGKNLQYRPKDGSEPFVPHVIEPSFGVERAVMAVLVSAYEHDKENERIVLKLPVKLAPVKVAVSPLLKNKPELVKKAKEVYGKLKKEIGNVMWDDNGNIGKRYRRQDEIGTPYCVTIDFDTLEDNTVTLRNRDTTKQTRVKADKLTSSLLKEALK